MRRLMRPMGYRVLLASGGLEAFAVLEKVEVDVLISAMRLPRMSGIDFLGQASQRWPHVMRILLAPYSDLQTAVHEVKEGRIFRYLSKPWKDQELKLLVAQAVEHRHLLKDKLHLLAAIRRQKQEILRLKSGLEANLKQRMTELVRGAEALRNDNQKLKENYASAVKVAVDLLSEGLGVDAAQAFLEKQESRDQTVVQAFLENLVEDDTPSEESPGKETVADKQAQS